MKKLTIGILALQGGVIEHILAMKAAAESLRMNCNIIEVRSKEGLVGLDGIIIPGGESTVLQKLCERENMFDDLKKTPAIFGTCAGAIMLAKKANNKEAGQRTLELMDIEIDRNGYGRQNESFEQEIRTEFGLINAIFIRAPRIKSVAKGVNVLAENNGEIIACEEKVDGRYYLALCFHPELSSSQFHSHFLRNAIGLKS
jgi:5'-phosphate synthase pdxT subunit